MASSALRSSLPRCGSRRRILLSHPPSADAVAASSLRRFFHSGEGDFESMAQLEEHMIGGRGSDDRALFQQLDKVENTRAKIGMGSWRAAYGLSGDRRYHGSNFLSGDRSNGTMDGYNSLQDGEGNFESVAQFEERMFGGRGSDDSALFQQLDKVENTRAKIFMGSWRAAYGLSGDRSNGTMDGYNSLQDGMDEKLDYAARTFQMTDEVEDDDYDFRPDVNYRLGSKYNVRDLDLTRPAAPKNPQRPQFETSTKEVLKKADFRNVRFLSNFLTEAGIIIKRSQTKISAKAQRKVAREIKTARALGLMPFTTMGKRPFIFGRSVEEEVSDEEYEYDFVEQKDTGPEDDAMPDMEAA